MSSGDRIATDQIAGTTGVRVDELVRRVAARTPAATALVDPPDRSEFTDGAPRRLSYAQLDRAVDALASRLLSLGLPARSVVAYQMPNIAESVIVLLGVLRAGMIAAPMPLLWRQADAVAALQTLAPRALITVARLGDTQHAELMMHVAAEIFSVRFVLAFGRELPDGIVSLEEVFDPAATAARDPAPPHPGTLATFDVTARSIIAVTHGDETLVGAGNAVAAEGGLRPSGAILGALALSSFAAIGTQVLPWLITGGTLVLHQPFSPNVLAAQMHDERCGAAVVPAAVLSPLHDAGLLDGSSPLRTVVSVWRSPEFLASAVPWPRPTPACVDVAAFGEIAIIPQRRGSDGSPAGIPLGALPSQPGVELARTPTGTLAVRTRTRPLPRAAEATSAAPLKIDRDGFVDTEYPCRLNRNSNTLVVSGPPVGVIGVGGYRFAWRELQDLLLDLGQAGSLAALPDRLAGHRLAGVADDPERLRRALAARGINPLVVAAFRDRP